MRLIFYLISIFAFNFAYQGITYGKVLNSHYMTKAEIDSLPENFSKDCKLIFLELSVDEMTKNKIIQETRIPEDSFKKLRIDSFSMKYIYIENKKCIPSAFYSFPSARTINEEIKGWLMFNKVK